MLFTSEELSKFDGKNNGSLYLCCLGQIFDVSSSRSLYENGPYKTFIGRDSTRAFCTGDFTDKGSIATIKSLTNLDLSDISDWINKFHKKYRHVGNLIGIYYNENGEKTELLLQAEEMMKKGYQERSGTLAKL